MPASEHRTEQKGFIGDDSNHQIILTLILGSILPLLDSTALGIAIPALSDAFASSVQALQKVVTLYGIAAAVTVPLCAWGMKRYNNKSVWLLGLILFLLASVACATAGSLNLLVTYRIFQGVGAGILMATMQPVLLNAVGREQFKAAMASVAIPAVIVPILGPLVAGFIVNSVSWKWIFLLNIPISLFAILLAWCYLPNSTSDKRTKLDIQGYLLFACGLATVIYGLSEVSSESLDILSVSALGLVVLSLSLIGYYVHYALTKSFPILDVRLFRIPPFRNTALLLFLSSLVFYSSLFILPSIFIERYGYSTLGASAMLGASGLGALLSRSYLQKLTSRFSTSKVAMISVLISLIGTLPLLCDSAFDLMPLMVLSMLLRGAGLGLMTLLTMTHLYHYVPEGKTPDTSAWSRILTILGGAIGTSSIGFFYQWEMTTASHQTVGALAVVTLLCLVPAFSLKRSKA
ncbi:DHA2 family efflux MFS transporter permease subunit [Marinomonas sp. RS-M-Aa-14]|uniref:DHA2 family efflux MFS transporter permease subunit n=1 Tax=Marinomonas sp. RS-M-Aa-14 TaxID=3241169 RepID=UPI00390C9619